MTDLEFEALKRDFIEKNLKHIEALEKLTVQDLQLVGTKSQLAVLRSNVILSYQRLSIGMFEVPAQIGQPRRVDDLDENIK